MQEIATRNRAFRAVAQRARPYVAYDGDSGPFFSVWEIIAEGKADETC